MMMDLVNTRGVLPKLDPISTILSADFVVRFLCLCMDILEAEPYYENYGYKSSTGETTNRATCRKAILH